MTLYIAKFCYLQMKRKVDKEGEYRNKPTKGQEGKE